MFMAYFPVKYKEIQKHYNNDNNKIIFKLSNRKKYKIAMRNDQYH